MRLVVHTDGGARDNGKPNSVAAYGACGRWKDESGLVKKFTIVQRLDTETNNQMELRGVITALRIALKQDDTNDVSIVMDSAYVRNGITQWIENWKRNGWKTAAKKPVKNKELWIQLDKLYTEAMNRFDLDMGKVKGHAGEYENEHIDSACTWAMNNLEDKEIKAEWGEEDHADWNVIWKSA